MGAAGLCIKHSFPYKAIIDVFSSALKFSASDQSGELSGKDEEFIRNFTEIGVKKALTTLCGLDPVRDKILIEAFENHV